MTTEIMELQKTMANIPSKETIDKNLLTARINCIVQPENQYLNNFLHEISRKVSSASTLSRLVDDIMQMTQSALRASASSVILYDEKKDELYFDVAEGKAGKMLKRIRLDSREGIAGCVFQSGRPLIINDVTKDKRFNKQVDNTTGFKTESILCVPLVVHRKVIGVLEVLNKLDGSPFDDQDLYTLQSVASTAAMAIENTRLHHQVLTGYKSTIKALAAAIDAKDPYTCGHSHRVMQYALLGGKALSLSQEELDNLENAAILHDIGKIGIPDSILLKPGPLTSEEWDIMRSHSLIGAKILKKIPFLEETIELVLHHHERCDGNGYLDKLKGKEIPIGARLLAVADTFDTITTNRSYRMARDADIAIAELRRYSGTQFCPTAVEAFISGYMRHKRKN